LADDGKPWSKRPASPPAEHGKRAKEQQATDILPDIPSCPEQALVVLSQITQVLRERPFCLRASPSDWALKRRLYSLLGGIVAAAEIGGNVRNAAADLIDQLVCSGYAQSSMDRRALVTIGVWKPAMAILKEAEASASSRAAAVLLYIYLVEHIHFYDDFFGPHSDFWSPDVFRLVLQHVPAVVTDVPDTLQADQWELVSQDLEAALKMLGSYLLFWTSSNSSLSFDLAEAMPLLDGVVDVLQKFDSRFGKEISAKSRGAPLEELTRLSGVLTQCILSKFDDGHPRGEDADVTKQQVALLLNFLVRLLMLRIPTCAMKAEGSAPSSGMMPVDERQQDSDWIETLWEHCLGFEGGAVQPSALCALFDSMADMPLEEQRYRLECISPMVTPFIAIYARISGSESYRQSYPT